MTTCRTKHIISAAMSLTLVFAVPTSMGAQLSGKPAQPPSKGQGSRITAKPPANVQQPKPQTVNEWCSSQLKDNNQTIVIHDSSRSEFFLDEPVLAKSRIPAFLRSLGFNVSTDSAAHNGLELTVSIKSEPLFGNYMAKGQCFTGAKVNGDLVVANGNRTNRTSFSSELRPPGAISHCPETSNLAPFGEALQHSQLILLIAAALGEAYGPVAEFCTLVAVEKWTSYAEGVARRILELDHPKSMEALIELARLQGVTNEAVDAITAAGAIGVNQLIQFLTSPDTPYNTRFRAAWHLARSEDSEVLSTVAALRDSTTNPEIKIWAHRANYMLGDDKSFVFFFESLQTNLWTAPHARQLIMAIASIRDQNMLGLLIARIKEPWVSTALTETLGVDYQLNEDRWRSWWKANKDRFPERAALK